MTTQTEEKSTVQPIHPWILAEALRCCKGLEEITYLNQQVAVAEAAGDQRWVRKFQKFIANRDVALANLAAWEADQTLPPPPNLAHWIQVKTKEHRQRVEHEIRPLRAKLAQMERRIFMGGELLPFCTVEDLVAFDALREEIKTVEESR